LVCRDVGGGEKPIYIYITETAKPIVWYRKPQKPFRSFLRPNAVNIGDKQACWFLISLIKQKFHYIKLKNK
jgi:hypothetical protein